MNMSWLSPMAQCQVKRRAEESLARLKQEADSAPVERIPPGTPIRITLKTRRPRGRQQPDPRTRDKKWRKKVGFDSIQEG